MVKEAVVSPAIFLSVVAYVFIGAGILMAFEQPTELHNCELANQAIATIIKQSAQLSVPLPDEIRTQTKVTEELTIMTKTHFNHVFEKAYQIHLANPNLLTSYDSTTKNWTCPNNWSFGNSVWNAGTMIASLGFGYTAPITFNGKLFTSLYLMVGVPLFFMSIFLLANQIVAKTLGPLMKLTSTAQVSSIVLYTMFIILLCSLAPAAIIHALENMSLFDAWYFCITSITTVGFGDIRLTGVANAVWLIWLIFSLVNFFTVAIIIYRKLTMSEFKKQGLNDEQRQQLLHNQADGRVNYGGGLQYHPTGMPLSYHVMAPPPPGYDENDYKTLSTIQVRPVDPQLDLTLEINENESTTEEKPKIVIEDEESETSSIQEDRFAEVKPLVKQ